MEPEIPGALRNLMEQNALFALMGVIGVAGWWAAWKFLNKHIDKLEEEAKQTKVLEDIKIEMKDIRDEMKRMADELVRLKL